MTKKFNLLFVAIMLIAFSATAQNGVYKEKPQGTSEFGISLGWFGIQGDVDARLGFGAGLVYKKDINYDLAWRIEAMYGQGYGLNTYRSGDIYRSSKTTYYAVNPHLVYSLSNLFVDKASKKNNLYVFAGFGVYSGKSERDMMDDTGVYSIAGGDYAGLSESGFARWGELNDIHDREYETEVNWTSGILGNADNPIGINLDFGIGWAFNLNKKMNFAIEQKFIAPFQDHLDAYAVGQAQDLALYTSVRLNFNLNKERESLQFANALTPVLEDLAEVKARPVLDLTDTDGDGIIDMLDAEKESPTKEVDTRGVTLDSDGDGIPNYKDTENFSPAGYDIDGSGKAQIPPVDVMTEAEVKAIARKEGWYDKGTVTTTGLSDWFLPIIHFDLNSYAIKKREIESLYQVAQVMKANPSIRVVATGHTDKLSNDTYNRVLSYNRAKAAIDYLVSNYGISRDRLVLNWGGEENNLVPSNGGSMMNRRVEFKVATTESEMGRPEGPDAGKGGSMNTSGY